MATTTINFPISFLCKSPKLVNTSPIFLQRDYYTGSVRTSKTSKICGKRALIVCALPLGIDPWGSSINSQNIASLLFALSLFPYIGFLYFITKSKTAPNLTLFGFYFLLVFVAATIPAGIYEKVQCGTSLSNVDWLHGGTESLLTLTNLFIVLGLREGLRKNENSKENTPATDSDLKEEKKREMKV